MKVFKRSMAVLLTLALTLMFSCNTATPKEQTEEAPASEPVVLTLAVEGMTCTGCEQTVQEAVAKVNGITEVKASHLEKIATITFTGDMADTTLIMEAVTAAGYKPMGFVTARQDTTLTE